MARVQIEKSERGFLGKLIKWLFILFEIIMIGWVSVYWLAIGKMAGDAADSAAQAGTAIGGTIGTVLLFIIWAAGTIILGILTALTRRRVLVEIER